MEKTCRAVLPVALTVLAGYVDAIGFLRMHGLFVSFMSGNSTQLGVALGRGGTGQLADLAMLIAAFVGGVILGALLVHAADARQQAAVLALEAAALLAAAGLQGMGQTTAAVVAMTLAMGVENNVFQREGYVSIGLTYMTGALVKMGQGMALALMGGPRLGWVADFLLWAGLVAGAALGAAGYRHDGLAALWPAAIYAAVAAAAVFRTGSAVRNI